MLETLETITLALVPGFIVLDVVYRARKQNPARGWHLRALAVTVGIFFLSAEIAAVWGNVFDGISLLNLAPYGTLVGTIVGILVYELIHYWYHRLAHSWNWLWRAGHQMHHSAESLDAFGAYYQHPFDAAVFATIASLVFFPLLGVTVEAGVIAILFLTFNAMFQHANIRTPYWLGFLIQRPESHTIHHGMGIHHYNYSDLPIWDMVFGTFINPRSVDELDVGFYQGGSGRILDMLVGMDVSRPKSGFQSQLDTRLS